MESIYNEDISAYERKGLNLNNMNFSSNKRRQMLKAMSGIALLSANPKNIFAKIKNWHRVAQKMPDDGPTPGSRKFISICNRALMFHT